MSTVDDVDSSTWSCVNVSQTGRLIATCLWLRVRGSWLHEENRPQDGSDIRVILRYDLPVI